MHSFSSPPDGRLAPGAGWPYFHILLTKKNASCKVFILYIFLKLFFFFSLYSTSYSTNYSKGRAYGQTGLTPPSASNKNNASRIPTPKERQTKGLSEGFTLHTPRLSHLILRERERVQAASICTKQNSYNSYL